MNRLRLIAFSAVALLPALALADDAAWGHLSGRFTYGGDPPPAKRLRVTKDIALIGETVEDESLVVNAKNRGIANVVVYLLADKADPPAVHPMYAHRADAKVEWAIDRGRYEPHVLLLRTTQTLKLKTHDRVGYNPKILSPMAPALGLLPTANSPAELPYFVEQELVPVPAGCNIHPWLSGYLLVRSNPYMAKTLFDGHFAIENLPVGRHTFCLWHERIGYLRNVRIGPFTSDAKGRITVPIRKGDNALNETELAPELFARDD